MSIKWWFFFFFLVSRYVYFKWMKLGRNTNHVPPNYIIVNLKFSLLLLLFPPPLLIFLTFFLFFSKLKDFEGCIVLIVKNVKIHCLYTIHDRSFSPLIFDHTTLVWTYVSFLISGFFSLPSIFHFSFSTFKPTNIHLFYIFFCPFMPFSFHTQTN